MPDHDKYAELSKEIRRLTKRWLLLRKCCVIVFIAMIVQVIAGIRLLIVNEVTNLQLLIQTTLGTLLLLKDIGTAEVYYYHKLSRLQTEATTFLQDSFDGDR